MADVDYFVKINQTITDLGHADRGALEDTGNGTLVYYLTMADGRRVGIDEETVVVYKHGTDDDWTTCEELVPDVTPMDVAIHALWLGGFLTDRQEFWTACYNARRAMWRARGRGPRFSEQLATTYAQRMTADHFTTD